MAYYEMRGGTPIACDTCGGVIDGSERGRTLHAEWHREREEIVVDLREVKSKVA